MGGVARRRPREVVEKDWCAMSEESFAGEWNRRQAERFVSA
jgi:hypothetical protein